MKKILFLLIFIFLSDLYTYSQNTITIYTFKDKKVNDEILKILTSHGKFEYKDFKYCTLYYFILDNYEGSAGMHNDEFTSEIYIALKDKDSLVNLPKLYVLKNIYDLKLNSVIFEEGDNGITINFDNTITKKSKTYKKDLNMIYSEHKNEYKFNFKSIKKIN